MFIRASVLFCTKKQTFTPGRQQFKMPILSRKVDQKSLKTEFSIAICRHTGLETEFSIAICRHAGDQWQLKTLFLTIFDLRSSIVDSVFDCHLPGVILFTYSVVWNSYRKTFTVDGFWNPSPKLQANSLGPLLEDAWNVEKKRCEVEQ